MVTRVTRVQLNKLGLARGRRTVLRVLAIVVVIATVAQADPVPILAQQVILCLRVIAVVAITTTMSMSMRVTVTVSTTTPAVVVGNMTIAVAGGRIPTTCRHTAAATATAATATAATAATATDFSIAIFVVLACPIAHRCYHRR
jgi:hypothetical protein